MNISGIVQRKGIKAMLIIAYKFPAAFTVGSIPNGPPGGMIHGWMFIMVSSNMLRYVTCE